MNSYKHSTKRAFIAWLLLAIFMLPMVVRTVHVCQEDYSSVDLSVTVLSGHHTQGHHPDKCPICSFTFFSFVKPGVVLIETLFPVGIGIAFPIFVGAAFHKQGNIIGLRAPPTLFMA